MMRQAPLLLSLITLACGAALGCRPATKPVANPGATAPRPPSWDVTFVDAAVEAGVDYRLGHGGKTPLTILETTPGGCAFVDLERDGWLDIVLVGTPRCAVYRNRRDGTFQDVTKEVGLDQPGPWMGCTVGDYDNDAYPDLVLTGYRRTALFRNDRGRRLIDVTSATGVGSRLWTTSAAFSDVDGDGWLDLYVAGYLDYQIGVRDLCTQGTVRFACGPEMYGPERGILYRNQQGKRFVDYTAASGLNVAAGKTWGVAFSDFDNDGKPDLYLANDQVPGNLFHNQGAGRFAEIGIQSGTAYDPAGQVQGGMGVDWADYNEDGRMDLFVTTYVNQEKQLYRNEGGECFSPMSRQLGIAQPALPHVAFGCGFLDANNDGALDLIIANGHIRDNAGDYEASQKYRQPLQLYASNGERRYQEVSNSAGPAFAAPLVGRGSAFGDYNNDGLMDVLVMDLEGPARLLRNEGGARAGNWLSVQLNGGPLNCEGIGARVTVEAGGRRQVREIARGRSVLSASDACAHFGLGQSAGIDRLHVRWPDGRRREWLNVAVNQRLTLRQDSTALGRVSGHRAP